MQYPQQDTFRAATALKVESLVNSTPKELTCLPPKRDTPPSETPPQARHTRLYAHFFSDGNRPGADGRGAKPETA